MEFFALFKEKSKKNLLFCIDSITYEKSEQSMSKKYQEFLIITVSITLFETKAGR